MAAQPASPRKTGISTRTILIAGGAALVLCIGCVVIGAIIHSTGNKGSRLFGVTGYNADNEQVDSLVLSTDPYDGIRPLDFRDGQKTTRLEVKATGDWAIEILPLEAAQSFEVPGSFTGTG